MKNLLVIACIFLTGFAANADDEFTLKVTIGDTVKVHHIERSKTKEDVYDFFQKKMNSLFKMKPHNKNFCRRENIQLTAVTKNVKKDIVACARSKQKLTKELVQFSNLVQVEFGKR
ncbi:MAG: hypothetical protein ACXVAX_08435 [Pseudobdellovibrio sp.]